MAYIVSLLIVALCLYMVIVPLLKKKVAIKQVDVETEFDDTSLKHIYATLNELEMDYNMQKLTDEDYGRLKSEYEKFAAELIAKEKREEAKVSKNSNQDHIKDIEAEIEEELAKLRKERAES